MLVRYAKRLGQLIVAQGQRGEEYNENLGRYVAAAFIAMERLDNAPGVRVDDGRSGNGITGDGDQS